MGRNGAGKSTLLKSFVGLSPLTSGSVRIGGKDPKNFSSKELIRNVAYIPQEPSDMLVSTSVSAECAQADFDNGLAAGSTLALYQELMDIPNLSAHPRDLSEGQRLGLVLSIALGTKPTVIVLDEPTRGLDYSAKRSLIKILRKISEDGSAVILATHDVELVAEVADRVQFIAEGELIADGDSHDVLTASPAFAPQVAKAFPERGWISVSEVAEALKR
jgi:energy-coupling factor transport system ATP-binding protein